MWESYWEKGYTACCLNEPEKHYDSLVREVWKDLLATLQGGNRILDLGTGNGGVLVFAQEHARQQKIFLHLSGIDCAKVLPLEATDFTSIDIRENTAMEQLPFEDESFDAVTSQFAIEYANHDDAITEALRVLKPNGRGGFLIHAQEGLGIQKSIIDLREIDELLETDVFAVAKEALRTAQRAEASGSKHHLVLKRARQAVDVLERCLKTLENNWQDRSASQVFHNVGSIIEHTFANRNAFPRATVLSKITELQTQVSQHQQRLQASIKAARSRRACRETEVAILNHGAKEVSTTPIRDDDKLFAWFIEFNK